MQYQKLIIILLLLFIGCSKNSHIGKYYSEDEPNLGLELREDRSFVLFNSKSGVEAGRVGKYSIKGNEIILEFDTGFEGKIALKG